MSAVRGSLQELVARLAALDAQREALRAEIASRLGMGPAPRQAQARAPRAVAAGYVPTPEGGRPPEQFPELLAMARRGPVRPTEAARRLRMPPSTIASRLAALVRRGELVRTESGDYTLPTSVRATPQRPPGRRRRHGSHNAVGPERRAEVIALAKRDGELTVDSTAALFNTSRNAANKVLSQMATDGELVRVGIGRYVEAAGKSKARAVKRIAPKGQREAEVLALAARVRLTTASTATALGITPAHASVLLSKLTTQGKLARVADGLYAPPSAPPAPEEMATEEGAKDTDRTMALAAANGGVVDIEAVMKAGIKDKRPLVAAMLRKLHGRGRLVRIAPETYATPDQAAKIKQERKAERTQPTP